MIDPFFKWIILPILLFMDGILLLAIAEGVVHGAPAAVVLAVHALTTAVVVLGILADRAHERSARSAADRAGDRILEDLEREW